MKTFLKIFLLFFFLIIIDTINAQPITWQRIFGLDSNVSGEDGIQTKDGGYVILCRWDPISAYPWQTRVIKLDKFGNLIWTRNYLVYNTYNAVIEDDDSGYILVGEGLFKINSSGDSILYKTYGGRFYFIKKYYDGGFIMTGDIGYSAYIVRVDNNFNIIWANTYHDSYYDEFFGGESIFDPNNNIAITIYGFDMPHGLADGGILKLNPDGNLYLKQFYITYPVKDGFGNILVTNDNKYAISGYADLAYDSVTSVYCLLDTNGNLLYRKYYYDYPSSYYYLTNATGNNLILGGSFTRFTDIKMAVRKIDYNGNIIWTRIINEAPINSGTFDIKSTFDGGYLLTGYYENVVARKYSIYIVKTDSNAYANPLGVSNPTTQIPERFILYQNYPNPFNPSTTITYEISTPLNPPPPWRIDKGGNGGFVSLKVYDITGKEVSILVNEFKQAGRYNINFDGTNLPSGIYFYKLEVSGRNLLEVADFVAVKRMILIK